MQSVSNILRILPHPNLRRSYIALMGFALAFGGLGSIESSAQEAASVGAVAAKQFFKQGLEAARKGEFPKAATKFAQAIKSDGGRPEYRAALAGVYLEQSQTKNAWEQVRLAMKSGAGDLRIANQLFTTWNAFGSDGLFQAGTVKSTIRKMLGEPDRVNKSRGNERWFYDFMGIDWAEGLLYATIDLRGVLPSNLRPLAQLRIDPDKRWRVEYRVSDRSQNTTHYFVPGSDSENDSTGNSNPSSEGGAESSADDKPVPERFVIQRFFQLAEQGVSPRKWMEQIQRTAERTNSKVVWEIVDESDDRLIFEWRQEKADAGPAQHELALVMSDGRDLHHAAYSKQVSELDVASKEKWISIFESAKLHRYKKKSESIPERSLAPTKD